MADNSFDNHQLYLRSDGYVQNMALHRYTRNIENNRNQAPPVPCSRANRCQHANNGGNNTADTETTTRAWITLQLDLLSAPPQRSETILIIAERENNPPPFYTPPPTYQDAWFDS
ncbi:hypothetical protein OUZ56_031539 [Daphnia magna]|uniref:Uncharacterized protein n=1 Tax=Daphnia magna TaxID=35525 RepID=A0ABQ9ZUI5_9CRUS|nr:hypothetical protein OUZ56_031539 [Daphnia magna]